MSVPASPTPTGQAAADHRWAEAVSIARGRPTPDALAGRRRRQVRVWVAIVVVLIAAALGAAAAVFFDGTGRERTPSAAHDDVQLVLTVVALVMTAAGFVIAVRTGQWGARWKSSLTPLDTAQRRQVMRQVRGKQEPDAEHPERLAVPLEMATRLAQPWGILLFAGGVAVNLAGQAIGGSGPAWIGAVLGVVVLSLVVAVVLILRDLRAAQRFLDRFAASGSQDAGERGATPEPST